MNFHTTQQFANLYTRAAKKSMLVSMSFSIGDFYVCSHCLILHLGLVRNKYN